MGQACPSDSTRRSAVGWFGCAGSYRMCVYMSTVTRCARLAADVGWPEPATVVMSSANLIRSIALACTEATKAIFSPSSLARVRVQSLRLRAGTHALHGIGAEIPSLMLGTGSLRRLYTLKRAIPMPPAPAVRRASWQAPHVVGKGELGSVRQCHSRPGSPASVNMREHGFSK